MRGLLLACFLVLLDSEVGCIQVNVPQAERSTLLFSSVTMRCDFSTSASIQDVLVTWRFKSFCKDPVLEYYSTAYQSALSLGQDPANDCRDSQRTVRTVMQKRGTQEAILGAEYRERRISIQNNADLVINEIMWWDNGVYICAVDAPGDTTGDNDKEVKLIVYHWLTVLLIVLGGLLLIILLGVCCCQCCPQRCCCYIRCPCCPEQCCCPEKAVMQHRMIADAQKAMAPWVGGQHLYAPMSQHSSQMNPLLYQGSSSGHGMPMNPMPLPPPQSMGYSMPPPSNYGNHTPGNGQMLDYMENQMRGMDMTSPMLQPQPMPPPHHNQMMGPPALSVPFSPGPPSMLSALNDDGPAERRVITLPPIREQPGSRMPPMPPMTRPPSSSSSSRNGYAYRRDDRGGGGGGGRGGRRPSPTRSRAMSRSYSQDSLDGGSRGAPSRSGDQGRLPGRSRSRDDLYDGRSRGNYSPPASHRSRRDSWSSDDEDSSRRGGNGRRGGGGGGGTWIDNPPSYTEYEPGLKPGKRRNERLSDKSSRSGTSVVI